jgi:4-amino-4-deoxy-L-arabinose transferase-like glycosyltransferase
MPKTPDTIGRLRAMIARPCTGWAILILLLIGNAVFLSFNSFRCFNFFDMCIVLDGGWRVLNGQRPYIDFLYFSGPLHLYVTALFFKLFGFGKPAILLHTITIHSLVIILNFIIARRYLRLGLSILVTLLTTACFTWPISFPWHDQLAYFWGILALAIFIRPRWEEGRLAGPSFFCGLLVTLSWLSKMNIGTAFAVMFAVTLLSAPARWRNLLSYGIGISLGVVLSLFLIHDPGIFFEQLSA